jgi:transcriptional regulator GlxA family with amidase domain
MRWAWRQLVSAHGNISVSAPAEEIGWSRRHFVARFRHHVRFAPKPAGRVLRFNRAVQLLTAERRGGNVWSFGTYRPTLT